MDMARGRERQPSFVSHQEDPLLNKAQVALLIGKSRNTVANWCRDGLLEVVREPVGERIRLSTLERYYGATALGKKRPLAQCAREAMERGDHHGEPELAEAIEILQQIKEESEDG